VSVHRFPVIIGKDRDVFTLYVSDPLKKIYVWDVSRLWTPHIYLQLIYRVSRKRSNIHTYSTAFQRYCLERSWVRQPV